MQGGDDILKCYSPLGKLKRFLSLPKQKEETGADRDGETVMRLSYLVPVLAGFCPAFKSSFSFIYFCLQVHFCFSTI